MGSVIGWFVDEQYMFIHVLLTMYSYMVNNVQPHVQ
jgi:hypothetical protein